MRLHWRLLMASTVLSGLAGIGAASAANNVALPALEEAGRAPVILAQAEDNRTRQQQQRQEQRQEQRKEKQEQRQNQKPANANQKPVNANQQPANGNQKPANANQKPANASPPPPPAANRAPPPPPPAATRERPNAQPNNAQQENQKQQKNQQNQQQGQQDRGRAATPASPPQPPAATTNQRNNQGGQNQNQTREREQNQGRDNANRNQRDDKPDQSATPSRANDAAKDKPIQSGGKGKGVAVRSSGGQDIRRVDQLRNERREVKEGNRTVIREPDRTIIREGNNRTIIRHDENNRFRVGARDVRIERVGNDSRTIIYRPGGERIVTVTDRNGFLLRRSRIMPNGREIIIINNRPRVGGFFVVLPPPVIRIPRERYIVAYREAPPALIYDTLIAPPVDVIERPYTLDEVRYSPTVRDRMPRIDLNTITFESGSWDLAPEQVDKLAAVADGMKRAIEQNPQTVFLVEGYTDAVGDENDNLSLSDRRAESVAVALTEQFQVPPENLSTQGYGEQQPVEQTDGPSEANRRVSVRNIGPLLAGNASGQPPQGEPVPQ